MSLKYCPNYSVPLKGKDYENSEIVVYRARCKLWSCEYCANINRRVWQARIWKEVERSKSEQWTFFTFTLLGEYHGHAESLKSSLLKWRDVWDKLMKRLKREYGKFRYLRVFETHKDGTFHVHMLADVVVSDAVERVNNNGKVVYESETILGHLNALELGWIHDCKPIVADGRDDGSYMALVASYVAKYLTKDIQGAVRDAIKSAGLNRIRMIQTSHAWAKLETGGNIHEWEAEPVKWAEFDRYKGVGVNVRDVDRGNVVTSSDFHNYDYYPNQMIDRIDNRKKD